MKVVIDQSSKNKEVEIIIRCDKIDEELRELIQQIESYGLSVPCKDARFSYTISKEKVMYFEAVDDKVFAYCQDAVHECKWKLYEVEGKLNSSKFVRISKSCILNIKYLDKVKPLINGKYEAFLRNTEKLIINRRYVPDIKEKLSIL